MLNFLIQVCIFHFIKRLVFQSLFYNISHKIWQFSKVYGYVIQILCSNIFLVVLLSVIWTPLHVLWGSWSYCALIFITQVDYNTLFFLQFYKQFWVFLLFLWDDLGIFINCTVATVTLSGMSIFEATYFLKFPSTKYAKK